MRAKLIFTSPKTGKEQTMFDGEVNIVLESIAGDSPKKIGIEILPGTVITGCKFEGKEHKLVGLAEESEIGKCLT